MANKIMGFVLILIGLAIAVFTCAAMFNTTQWEENSIFQSQRDVLRTQLHGKVVRGMPNDLRRRVRSSVAARLQATIRREADGRLVGIALWSARKRC